MIAETRFHCHDYLFRRPAAPRLPDAAHERVAQLRVDGALRSGRPPSDLDPDVREPLFTLIHRGMIMESASDPLPKQMRAQSSIARGARFDQTAANEPLVERCGVPANSGDSCRLPVTN